MAKLKRPVNTARILTKMLTASGLENFSQLAKELDLTQQAVQSTRQRQSISLALLMLAAEKWHVSLDHLVYGEDTDAGASLHIARADGKGAVKLPAELFRHTTQPEKLRAVISDDRMYILQLQDDVTTDGDYAFGTADRAVIRKCELLLDGTIRIEGTEESLAPESLSQYKMLGRVVWHGGR